MPKTKEELQQLKNRYESLNKELKELTEEELKLVIGGISFENEVLEEPNGQYTEYLNNQQEVQQQVDEAKSRIEYANQNIDNLTKNLSTVEKVKYRN